MASQKTRGVVVASGFFALVGFLDIFLSLRQIPSPWALGPLSEALGRGALHFILAAGLWHRFALCRAIAMIYCLVCLVMYGVILGMAFAQVPLQIGDSIVLESLFEIPSCALLLPYLRSKNASVLFNRPLFGR